MKRKYLMTPGPSPVPFFVREALAKEIIHHRTYEFGQIFKDVTEGLKEIFCTKNPVLILTSSGTGAMEAAVTNLFSAKDKVVTISGGKFGERWAGICRSFGLDVIEMKIEWGTSPAIKELSKILEENKGVKGILTTLCETSTATVYDVEAIGKIARTKDVLLVVDAISGLGQEEFLPDSWGVDAVVSGSQKGFMLPPGLSFISLSQKAQEAIKISNLPKYYFNLRRALKSSHTLDTPYTPAVSLIVGLKVVVEHIKNEGVRNRWDTFKRLAHATEKAALSLGLEIFSKRPANSLTAICAPQEIKSGDIVKILRKKYGVSIAGGQAHLKNKIFRVAHMGWINEQDLIMFFSLLEEVLKESGCNFKPGVSLTKLQEALYV